MPPKTLPIAKARALIEKSRREEDVQQEIIAALRLQGWRVLQASEHRRRVCCPHCEKHFTPTGGRGGDKGVPDLIVSRDDFVPGAWIGLEVKGPRTAVSPEQNELAACERIFIVKSIAAAQAAINAVRSQLLNRKKEN